jgi:integrase
MNANTVSVQADIIAVPSIVQSDCDGLYIRERVCGKEIFRRLRSKDAAAAEMEARKIQADWQNKLKNLYLRKGVWYLCAIVRGVRISQSLQADESDLEGAHKKARLILDAARDGRWEAIDNTKLRRNVATVGEVLTVFEEEARKQDLRPETVRDYRNSLRLVTGVPSDSALRAMSTEELTRQTVQQYVSAKLSADSSASGRRSIKSTVRQARAIFGQEWALGAYADAGLKLPNMAAFVQGSAVKAPAIRYTLPARELIDATHAAGAKLRTDRPDLWAVYLLTYYLAMRAGEALAARWTWLENDQTGRLWMQIINRPDEGFRAKGSEGKIPVPVQVSTWLDELHAADPGRACILPGKDKTARRNLVKREFAVWMRGIGWTTRKAAHELRKLRGSEWYTKRGLEVACSWLRHADPSTTKRFYADFTAQPPTLEVGE